MSAQMFSARDTANFSAAVSHFHAGRHDAAVKIARELTRRYPVSGLAHKLLGSALHAQGRSTEAVAMLRVAAKLLPDDAQVHTNLGNALAAVGAADDALQAHRRAIGLQPDAAAPRYNLGCVLLAQQRRAEALEQFWLAYERSPEDAELARLCRELLLELGDRKLAQAFCRMNLECLPDDAGAMSLLGGLLLEDEEAGHDEAVVLLNAAVQRVPSDAVAWSNLCVSLGREGEYAEACSAGERAVALAPDWAAGYNNLGVVLRDAGAFEHARHAFLEALERDADYADAYYNLGCACADLADHATARSAYIEAVKRAPRADWILLASHACRQLADWDAAELLEAELARQLVQGELSTANMQRPSPFAYLTTPGADPSGQLQVARHFAAQFAGRAPIQSHISSADARPLRVGLLSSDFRDHATAHLMAGVIEALDPERIHLIAYDYTPAADDLYRRRLMDAIPEWVLIAGLSDLAAAQKMKADGVDIVIDLKGWTQGYRAGILAYRPAALQMQWLGYPGTMGAPWIDYIVADPVVIADGMESAYSEKILRLPHCYQPNDHRREVASTPPRAALGLPEDAFVLAAFHQPYKITREVFSLWLNLLARMPDAVLWMLEAPPEARDAMLGAAVALGVDPARLVWAPRVAAEAHLGRFGAADLALDTFPVNAHTTASDALWAGVPQLARCGDTFVSRVSASIVTAAGLPELVTHSDADYEALVVSLAADPPRLSALRARLQAQRRECPLFDTNAFARHLEAGLEQAWSRHVAGLAPAHLAVVI